MSYRTRARRQAINNRQYVRLSLDGLGKCPYCSPHKGDNDRNSRSQWGKKVAARRYYTTGKGRKELPKFMRKWYDKHYQDKEDFESWRSLDNKYYEIDKGYLADSLQNLGEYIANRKNKYATLILKDVDNIHSSGTISLENNNLSFRIYVTRKRKPASSN